MMMCFIFSFQVGTAPACCQAISGGDWLTARQIVRKDYALSVAPPRRGRDVMRRIKQPHVSGTQAMPGEDVLRRTGRDAGKAWLAAGQPHVRCNREPEHVIAVHEHAE